MVLHIKTDTIVGNTDTKAFLKLLASYFYFGLTRIHVVDGGFQDTGEAVVDHIKKYYDDPTYIDCVVVTHPDGDHAGGLRDILEQFGIGELWMLRPWEYADEIIHRFTRFTSVDNLKTRLREIYPSIAKLEEIADEHDIRIYEPFQGAAIGEFIVMAPTKDRYLDLVVESEKTPECTEEPKEASRSTAMTRLQELVVKALSFVKAAWGVESFSPNETSAENNMSVIQYANLCAKRILLTADAGRDALTEAADYAPVIGLTLPGLDRIQVPHHGSRRNVSTKVLDSLFGPRLGFRLGKGEEKFIAIISAAQEDEDHPRKAVVRSFIHRGARVATTKEQCVVTGNNAPIRENWTPIEEGIPYPEEQEE